MSYQRIPQDVVEALSADGIELHDEDTFLSDDDEE